MRLQYGGYTHEDNEVWFNITKRVTFTPRGYREKELQRWDINGVLIGESVGDVTSKMAALESGYSSNGQDLKFYDNSGGLTIHQIVSSDTINGTRVEKLEWLAGNGNVWGSGTEYTNKRSYHIVVLAETLWSGSDLYYYQSSVSATGTCGPRQIWMPSMIGLPMQQYPQLYTTQKIVQSGMSIGMTDYYTHDPPLFSPVYEQLDMRRIVRSSPMEFGVNKNLKFPTRWSYFFETPVQLVSM